MRLIFLMEFRKAKLSSVRYLEYGFEMVGILPTFCFKGPTIPGWLVGTQH